MHQHDTIDRISPTLEPDQPVLLHQNWHHLLFLHWEVPYAEGDAYAPDANAPVSLRAVAHFKTATGSFQKILMKTFPQQGTGPREGH